MDTEAIDRRLSHLSCYLGCFPRDMLPTAIPRLPAALVINTDDHTQPGQHWVAIFINSNLVAEYFDSYGLEPLFPEIYHFLYSHCISWTHNPITLQSVNPLSQVCGHFCVLFILFRCSNLSFCNFLSLFTRNAEINDSIISLIFQV